MNKLVGQSNEFIAYKAGSHEAFKALYDKFYSAYYYYIYRLCKDADLAREIVVYAFGEIWERRELIKDENHLKGALYTIMYNRFLKGRRYDSTLISRKKELSLSLEDANTILGNDEVVRSNGLDMLYRAVEELAPQQRKIIEMVYLQGISVEDTAGLLQLKYQTVINHRNRALVNLRRKLPGLEYLLVLLEFLLIR